MEHMEHMAHELVNATDAAGGAPLEPAAMRERCDGTLDAGHYGSWQGHMLPGLLFVFWGTWMAYSALKAYLASTQAAPQSSIKGRRTTHHAYASRAWRKSPWRSLPMVEPFVKMVAVVLGLLTELRLDHESYVNMVCPPGTKHAGEFVMPHIHNWQHAGNYPAFFISGVVDILVHYLRLPHEISQVFLGLAFSIQAFLMGTHTKHIPLDAAVHIFVFYSMLGCAVSALLEAAFRSNVMLSMSRAFFVILQGGWLCMAARILFEERPAWSMAYMGSAMVAPLMFAMLALCVAVGLAVMFGAMVVLERRGGGYAMVPGRDVEMTDVYDSAHDSHSEDGRH